MHGQRVGVLTNRAELPRTATAFAIADCERLRKGGEPTPRGNHRDGAPLSNPEPEGRNRLGLRQLLSQTNRGEPNRLRTSLMAELALATYFFMASVPSWGCVDGQCIDSARPRMPRQHGCPVST
jgi:hypothetical protein